MILLSEEQLNNLDKEALVILFSSLQDQLVYVQKQLDTANEHLSDNNKQIELLTEQIRILNQRHFGRKSESALTSDEGQMTIFDFFNEAEYLVKQDLNEPEITEVVVSSYRRSNKTKGKREADLEGLPARVIDHRLSEEELSSLFPEGYKELPESTNVFTSSRKPLLWTSTMSMYTLPKRTPASSGKRPVRPTCSGTASLHQRLSRPS